ncbi:tyrosine-type recombinase/integrase [Nocardioides bruguierae]|uniref:tyrosine-type recombinase/integrase n=1 Tax=Nocardioides bruguierae TaxID=2945102 RepID=UPI0027DF2D93|nr:tyrosine-type recombinase/integrase [Nocardioides bruguierae]
MLTGQVSTRLGADPHKALNRNHVNGYVWRPALKAAGIDAGTDTGMHALWHFYASALLEAGVSIKALSEYLGHHDPAFTLRTYTHLMPTSNDAVRHAIDALWT